MNAHHFLPSALLALSLLHGTANAAELLLPGQSGGNRFAASDFSVRFNSEAAFALQPGENLSLSLPDGRRHEAILDRIVTHSNGDRTWIGHLAGHDSIYRVIVTSGQGLNGRILTPEGDYRVEGRNSFADADLSEMTGGYVVAPSLFDDGQIPPAEQLLSESEVPPKRQLRAASDAIIDIMVLYTPSLVSRYGSADTLINQQISLANQAYLDSNIGITLRLVRTEQVNYTQATDLSTTLSNLTYARDPVFSNIASLRTQVGADLVAMLLPYERATAQGCGVGWVGGSNGTSISRSVNFGYSVSAYGRDIGGSRFFCNDYTLTHELGHNMGSVHDRANASRPGAYSYSYGYGIDGAFGSIMSYISPVVGRFSNPLLTCSGRPCGVPAGSVDSADNAQSLNNTRFAIADYMREAAAGTPAVSASDRIFNWAQATYSTLFQPATSESRTADGYYFRYYPASNSYLGTRNEVLYYLDGSTGMLTVLGNQASFLAQASAAGY